MKTIENPILRGFNPDPSIIRVGEDYFIATSTFEWWPGVQIHHSRDLRNWRLLTRPLDRLSQLDLHGVPNSGGVWAPDLSHDGARFYLVYTNVKHWENRATFNDTPNFVVTAEQITGPWSEPIYLNSSGFDPSLFHDAPVPEGTGRKWLVNMRRDYRKNYNPFSGILLQEFNLDERKLTGESKVIFEGTSIGLTEGPHLYRRLWQQDWWYYLVVAEGGTEYEHAVTVARSKTIDGPFEVHPQNPLLTSVNNPELVLQKAGHASLVEGISGDWYLAHLCGRPLEAPQLERRHCNLGRETALQPFIWGSDGWPRLAQTGNEPSVTVPAPDLPDFPFDLRAARNDFDSDQLDLHFQSLRTPVDSSWLTLTERPGFLRLFGRESLNSRFRQSLIGRRLQSFYAKAETSIEFEPESFQQMAGLACFYDTNNWVYLRVSHDEQLGRTLSLLSSDNGEYDEPLSEGMKLEKQGVIYLRVDFKKQLFHFSFSYDSFSWLPIGPAFHSAKLSDDHCGGLAFTGTFICLCAQDLSGQRLAADFDYFEYVEEIAPE
jgi:xylan 1,4-beta-xylosidase